MVFPTFGWFDLSTDELFGLDHKEYSNARYSESHDGSEALIEPKNGISSNPDAVSEQGCQQNHYAYYEDSSVQDLIDHFYYLQLTDVVRPYSPVQHRSLLGLLVFDLA